MNLREQILQAEDLPREAVEIPEWGVTVYVREMTGMERDSYEGYILEVNDKPMGERMRGMRSRLAVMCTVDENGQRVFSDADFAVLGGKNASALDRIVNAASKLNALSSNEVEEIAGN